ncbi:PIN-like domain-containing protein [Streptomyces sp. NPDC050535]|uniref:PIN-like domain-containing protein n=1 Tax=Streptomyces sp. NPDC050535 TaxID=3365626 RepID=UPI0037A20B6A
MTAGEEPIGVPSKGLTDGFEGYLSPSDEDYRAVLTSGLVVLDTNVLLNLYRYEVRTRVDLIQVLERLSPCLWIPHQAADEFWRNREQTLVNRRQSTKEALEQLEKPTRAIDHAITNWARSVGLPSERQAEIRKLHTEAITTVREAISSLVEDDHLGRARDTNEDPVLQRLVPVLKVGPALPPEDYANALQEADARITNEVPPGYKDAGKPDHRGAGDYLVWEQTLREAVVRRTDVLLVTGDVKEDWWRKFQNITRGPRLELIQELRERAGTQLFMLQPQDLLRIAGRLLQVEVGPESVGEITEIAKTAPLPLEGATNRERIRPYLVTALVESLSESFAVHTGGSGSGSAWDVTVVRQGTVVAAVWIYDPIKPFNDLATDSVGSTGQSMMRELLGDRSGPRKPWVACVVDLASLLRGMSTDASPWSASRGSTSILSADAAEIFHAHADQLIDAGFDHIEVLSSVDSADAVNRDGFARIRMVIDLLKQQVESVPDR